MSSRKILFVSFNTCPVTAYEGAVVNGMGTYIYEIAREIGKKGNEVDIVVPRYCHQNTPIVSPAQNVRVIHLDIGLPSQPSREERLQHISVFSQAIQNFIKSEGVSYDTVHAFFYTSGLAVQKLQIPFVFSFSTIALLKNQKARGEAEVEPGERINAERELVRSAAKIEVASEYEKKCLVALYECPPEKVAVIPRGVDMELFKKLNVDEVSQVLGKKPTGKVILYAGRVEPVKGIDTLLCAVDHLRKRNPALASKVLIVGGGDDNGELLHLQKLRDELDLGSVVEFVPKRPLAELVYYYNYADVVVMPSLYEPYGKVALEAMACGTPAIVTDVSGVAGIFTNELQDLVVPPGDATVLADVLESALSSDERLARLSDLGEALARTMNWSAIADKILAIYP